ncbi:MAG: type II restriction endonuclease [Ignavibacteria bacterium]|nr:type II restriction endonuclease [Ignavibacteria bacterium]
MTNFILGSETAKKGFKNEEEIVQKFNNWKKDNEAKKWLKIMQYDLSEIESVIAIKIYGYKTDVQLQVIVKLRKAVDLQNIQVKLVSNLRGFNQIDKHWVDYYVRLWNIPFSLAEILKRYTGEKKPTQKTKDERRTLANEFNIKEQTMVLEWIKQNQSLIVSDILKGRGQFAAEWMLVAQKVNKNARWVLKSMNYCLNFFGNGDVSITQRGNFKIGRITMQRKGGDAGRKTANMLQFKINPAELFSESSR